MNKRMLVLGALVVFAVAFLMFSLHVAGKKPTSTVKIKVKGQEASSDNAAPDTESKPASDNNAGGSASGGEEAFWNETVRILEATRIAGMPFYYHVTKRDPMQPAFTYAEAASLQPFKLMIKGSASSLTGILMGKGKSAAIINERIYRVGDTVDGKKIVVIEKNRVILKKGADEEILRLESN